MNLIDSLTLIFLTLSAVRSAHIPREGGRGPHDVIPFMEVYNKSLCRPRELLVEILKEYPEEVEHIFIPSCVVLTRCAGCCGDETLQCTPISTYNVTMEIKRIKPQKQQNDIFMSFTEHSACECRLKKEVKEQREKIHRKGKGKGQKRKRKKSRDKTNHDAFCRPVRHAGTVVYDVKIEEMSIYCMVFFCFFLGYVNQQIVGPVSLLLCAHRQPHKVNKHKGTYAFFYSNEKMISCCFGNCIVKE